MNFLPSDVTSFVWGLAIGCVVIIFTGFGSEFGKDIYLWVKIRVGKPEPLKVSTGYTPIAYPPDQCTWVVEENVPNFEEKEAFFYPHPNNRGGKCYREVTHGHRLAKEYLMVRKQDGNNT